MGLVDAYVSGQWGLSIAVGVGLYSLSIDASVSARFVLIEAFDWLIYLIVLNTLPINPLVS